MKQIRTAVILVGLGLLLGFCLYVFFTSRTPQTTSQTDQEDLTKSATHLLAQEQLPVGEQSITVPEPGLPPDRYLQIDQVEIDKSGNWAKVTAVEKYRKSGEVVPGEPWFMLAHKVDGSWIPALPGMPEFKRWLDEIPTSFISEEEKSDIRYVFSP